jgi:hypothetical protein
MILIFVLFDIEVITAVPRAPQPIIPMRMVEFAFDPKAVDGLIMVTADNAAVL